jgi:GGDEF domain-containing protein
MGDRSRHELDRKMALVSDNAKRRHQCCVIIPICFTNYRALSAQFGIVAADQMLRIFGQRLASMAKTEEIWVRYATEIFCSAIDRERNSHCLTNPVCNWAKQARSGACGKVGT